MRQQDDIPPVSDESGGKEPKNRRLLPFITDRDLKVAGAAILLAIGAMIYLNDQFAEVNNRMDTQFSKVDDQIKEVAATVNENSSDLAVVKSEIMGLRRDVERLKEQAANADPTVDAEPVSLHLDQ